LQLEKGAPLLARRPALECARRFYHFQRRLLRSAHFLWAHRRCADCTTTARESFDAEECSLARGVLPSHSCRGLTRLNVRFYSLDLRGLLFELRSENSDVFPQL